MPIKKASIRRKYSRSDTSFIPISDKMHPISREYSNCDASFIRGSSKITDLWRRNPETANWSFEQEAEFLKSFLPH